MSLINSDLLMAEFPSLSDAGRRLLDFLDGQRQEGAFDRRYTTTRMFDIASDLSKSEVITLLAWLVSKGVLDQIIRVEGPNGGIGDFPSIEALPLEIEDWRQGNAKVEVKPENLSVLYKLHADV